GATATSWPLSRPPRRLYLRPRRAPRRPVPLPRCHHHPRRPSKNGLHYSREVLAAAFIDHPTAIDRTRARKRSLRDLARAYEAVHLDSDALNATLRLYKGAAWAYQGGLAGSRPVLRRRIHGSTTALG